MRERINVTKSSMPSFEEYCEEIKELWDTRWLTNMGAKHKKLESGLKEYLDVKNITLYTNGHMALENVIEAMDFEENSEIITTPFTFASTTHAIVRKGLVPIFCDINEEDYTIDVSKIEELITEKTRAIIPVHVYGNICDVEAIAKIAEKYNLKVIYDAAHAFGVKYKDKGIANYGDASMFSFHATKVFNTIEGGAVCYSNDEYISILDNLKNFGQQTSEKIVCAGTNAKMNEFCAAMGVCNLRHIEDEISKRKNAFEKYYKTLGGVEGIKLCNPQKNVKPNYSYMPVLFDGYKYTRDEVVLRLQKEEIYARKYFYPLTSMFECYEGIYGKTMTPVAKRISEKILTLPLYADLTDEDIEMITNIILNK